MQARIGAEREKERQDAERRTLEEKIAAEKKQKEEADRRRRHEAEEKRIIAVRFSHYKPAKIEKIHAVCVLDYSAAPSWKVPTFV